MKNLRQRGERYFTLKQAYADLNLSTNAVLNSISRLKKNGDLISPAKGLYVIVPPENQIQGSIPPEELVPILMKYLKIDYYVSLLSGAGFYGASHQKPSSFQIVTNKRIKHPLQFGLVKLELIYKKNLIGLPTLEFPVATGYVKVASPELIIMDMLNYPDRSGGLNHIATVLTELVESLDADKLVLLAEKSGIKSWVQRLGYILENLDPMDNNKSTLLHNKLQNYLNKKLKSYVSLAAELPAKGFPRIKKWHVIANTDIESDL